MDSIHVATAHIGLAEYFLTADKRQYHVATSAGLNSFLVES
jgi:predicted nucleic acid-binding protein